jgi:hypothetical protein
MKLLTNIPNGLRGVMLFMISLYCCVVLAGTDYYCDFSENGIYYLYVSGTTDEVAVSYNNYESGMYGGNYTNYSGYISVPATVTHEGKTYKVTAVSDHAFQECAVTTVNLPNTIKSIGYAAFLDCNQLTSVNLPSAITKIEGNAFNGCVVLNNLTLPSALKEIGYSAFASCKTFTSITIPDGVTTIDDNAFYGCSNLTSISIPNSVVKVGTSVFYGTAWYTNQPDGLVYVGKIAYIYKGTMPENTAIVVKDGTISLASSLFSGCANLVSISIPNSVTSMGNRTFYQCSGLTSIDIPSSVTFIGEYSFYGCKSLSSVSIPNTVTGIGNYAFDGCVGLLSITIPSSVKTIGDHAFFNCIGLAAVSMGGSFLSIGGYAFYGCSNLSSLIIKDGTSSIGDYSFYNCSNLSTISLPNSLTSIGNCAFLGSAWYTNQPDGVVYAGKVACGYKGTMSDLNPMSIKEGTLGIAKSAFNSYNFTTLTLPSTLHEIGPYAFYNCANLTSVTVLMEVPIPIDINTFNFRQYSALNVPYGSKAAYEVADYWKEFKEIIELEPQPTDISTLADAIYIEPFSGRIDDDVNIEVKLKNAETVTSYGFELVLPEGMSIKVTSDKEFDNEVTLNSNRHNNHTVSTNKLDNGNYKVAVASMSSKALADNDGLVLTIKSSIDKEMALGNHPIKIVNPLVVYSDATKPTVKPTLTTITIEDYMTGDVDGDGTIDLADAVLVINYYVGKTVTTFNAKAADVDGDGVIDLADAVKIISYYVGKIPALAPRFDWNLPEPE